MFQGRGWNKHIIVLDKIKTERVYFCREPAHEIPPMTRSWGGGLTSPAPALTLKMISVFLMLAILDYFLISVMQEERLPLSLSKQNQLRTLINTSPGRQYPIRLSRMKGVFQFRPLCWHSSLLDKCTNAHDLSKHLNHKQHKEPDHKNGPNRYRALQGWGSPIREHKNIILKVVIVKDLEK